LRNTERKDDTLLLSNHVAMVHGHTTMYLDGTMAMVKAVKKSGKLKKKKVVVEESLLFLKDYEPLPFLYLLYGAVMHRALISLLLTFFLPKVHSLKMNIRGY